MEKKIYTVEELMLSDSFLEYCLDENSADKEFWENEMKLHADQHIVFAEAKYMVNMMHGKLSEQEINQEIEKVRQAIHAGAIKHGDESKTYGNTSQTAKRSRRYLAYGLIAAVVVGITGLYIIKYQPAAAPQTKLLSEVSYASKVGERSTVTLPDGTNVILNSNSRITLRPDYNQHKRIVFLNGEAFFKVAKDTSRPFIVTSGSFTTTAVGTSFYVHAAHEAQDYDVDLLEGKVKLVANNKTQTGAAFTTMLLPGEKASWHNPQSVFTKETCDTVALKQWIKGKLSFHNVPVNKVLRMLEQWYAVDISVKNKNWKKLTLTGDYDNAPLEDVLKVICFTLSCKYRYVNNAVIIE